MSRKRQRSIEAEDELTAEDRLRELLDIAFDRDQIDLLLTQYRSQESTEAGGNDLMCCPREYEERFLREPVGPERACSRGKQCEGLQLLVKDPFVLREFIYPGCKPQPTRSMCLLCRRDEISRAYYRYETGSTKIESNIRITDHYNLVNVPGEYDVRDCIVSSGRYSGIPLPVVLHIRSAYSTTTKNGVRHLLQTRMRVPGSTVEESSSSGSFLMRRAALEKKVALSSVPLVEQLSS